MAAESLFGVAEADLLGGLTFSASMNVDSLVKGNNRSSRFTQVQAEQFIEEGWTVVQHQANKGTGFSGTLFRYTGETDAAKGLVKDELVQFFRSTEFADDAVRDNQATNDLEIRSFG
ncbi:MAG: hypothetical protein AB7I35_02265 [Ramlibacter sp.]